MPVTVQFASNRGLTGPAEDWRSYGNTPIASSLVDQAVYGTAFVNEVDLTADTVGAITTIQDVRTGGFSPQATEDLAEAGRNLLVFVHGFDNSFENAITRAAFNREWLAGSGVAAADMSVVAFSWPSTGRLLGLPLTQPYRADQQAATQSCLHLMTFLANLQPICDRVHRHGRKVFLLAHSMGNWALQGAVESWFNHGKNPTPLFDAVFLAAADEHYDSFESPPLGRFSGLDRLTRQTCILFSEADAVLGLSAAVNGKRRLGQQGPHARFDANRFPPDRYTMLDCSQAHDFEHGLAASHQYYRRSPSVRSLIAGAMTG